MKINRSVYVIFILGPCVLLAYAIGKSAKVLEKIFKSIRLSVVDLLEKALENTPGKEP